MQFLEAQQDPLSLRAFVALEKTLEGASDLQHMVNKLLYDATNEALINCYKAARRITVGAADARPGPLTGSSCLQL